MIEEQLCAKCHAPIPFAVLAECRVYQCSNCNTQQYTVLYPAIFHEAEKGENAEMLVVDEHATCFFHAKKVANVACDECGIFLCALCDLEVDNKHYCPKCFKNSKEKIGTLQGRTFLFDDFMLALAIVPIIFLYFTVLTAPATIIGSIYFWNKVKTPYPRSKWRFILAIIIATIEIIGWIALLIALVIFS